ncbi:hypothetical protein GUITHDRAFT_70601 [Guillardia theta CCMP2712]|uniref:Enoyl reductase (ER) domain-containing protein n=1 Tax=Guillardia theta (strain CCMP2712) TaxID=905079 RepID=L1JEG0_GUITC|nr:hypothetical protein GUITHDRAFT_70601 [Guillardia theta CCMP2712]EKX46524.1 hypothetical protein GUITHDRAFT_70601 [Guillardia theta CCMP2712]|eukprot:XP_005833504.1 hypothetical protein GUITHDRAFT_70601 [Guillardia theta CCMP2712]
MHSVVYDKRSDSGFAFKKDVATPKPGSKLIILRVLAASINPIDYKLPAIPGSGVEGKGVGIDVSGEVVHAPQGSGFQVGDQVFGYSQSGSLSEFCECVPSKVAKKPQQLSHIEAAMLGTAAGTSLQCLRDCGKVTAGDRVLIIGGSGGCGTAGIQIAKAMGCHVSTICSTKNADLVKSLGADFVHNYDTSQGPVPKLQSEDEKFDCIYDTVSSPEPHDTDYEPLARPLLREKPKRPMYVGINGAIVDWIRALASKVLPFNIERTAYKLHMLNHSAEDLAVLADMCVQGKLRSVRGRLLKLGSEESVKSAFDTLKSRRTTGKLVFGASDEVWEDYLKTCKK